MTTKRFILVGTAILVVLLVTSSLSFAQQTGADNSKAKQDTGMSAANQAMNNPITSYTLFITENDTSANQGKITDEDRYQNLTLIEPLLPVEIGKSGWNLINRPVIPLVSSEIPELNLSKFELEWDRKSGLGDIVFFSMLKPPSTGHFQWGIGPTLTMPTATHDEMGSEKWSAGPAAIALYSSKTLTYGALAQHWWSFAGDSDREDVSLSNFQYFVSYQFNEHWGFISAPTVVVDWEADSDDKWSVPVSAGAAYSFMLGKIPARVLLEPQYYVVQKDTFGPKWNVRFAFALVLPKF